MNKFKIIKTEKYLAYDIYMNTVKVNMGFESEQSAQYWINMGYAEKDYETILEKNIERGCPGPEEWE